MARIYGQEFPERALMSEISDILGIPHFTTARGGTVRIDFLRAVAGALGVADQETLRKDPLLRACVEAATGEPMRPALHSPGGTVTNDALAVIAEGIRANWKAGRRAEGEAPEGRAGTRADNFRNDGATEGLAEPLEFEALVNLFHPSDEDQRDRALAMTVLRKGQSAFRRGVMGAYGETCAITGCDATEALDAAHITPYRGEQTNDVTNGLLLRADVHRLFDRGALAIDDQLRVLVKPHLYPTQYATLEGVRIRVPRRLACRPSAEALAHHRTAAAFT